jgi:lipopolysaccharide transport system ATP-binding protein
VSDIVIRAEGLGKKYAIGHQTERARYVALRDVVARNVRTFLRTGADLLRGRPIVEGDEVEEFWALKDLSFEVRRGEVVGIIGRNGAGKSTLLKILTRITEPTTGRVEIVGRVASLLEVGTGFHPELAGRENILLNGAILGMTRAEIRRKFDEIVDFAGIERFLDTPVKRYSSGMYIRLAFAVAAHLDPEILVIDEVLAVGDVEFQKKCLGKMAEVAKGGRTVLFVSHNMGAVTRLCSRAMLLSTGRLEMDGDSASVAGHYMSANTGSSASQTWDDPRHRPGDDVARLHAVTIRQAGNVSQTVDIRYPVDIETVYECLHDGADLLCGVSFFDDTGTHLFVSGDQNDRSWSGPRPAGMYRSVCTVPGNLFAEGIVRVTTEVSTKAPVYQIHFIEHDSAAFMVVDTGEPGSVRGDWGRPIPGVMRPYCSWATSRLGSPRQSTAFRPSEVS